MLNNMSFYNFMHKQILVLVALFASTATSYVFFGIVYSSYIIEPLWYLLVLAVSYWGYSLHKSYSKNNYTIKDKEKWLSKLRYFIFLYFSTWTIMFIVYVSRDNIELHYLAIFTQLGVAVVATTILVTEKRLAIFILTSSMLPITIYLVLIGEFYAYVIAILTVVLAWVLLYGSRNTYNYLLRNQFQAYHDYLTKLGNRRYFVELLEDAIKIQKNDGKYMYLFLIDLDHFKTINDTLGHDIGDKLLIEVADRMKMLVKLNNNTVSRLGGDEFCILSAVYKDKNMCLEIAQEFAQELLHVIKRTYIIEEHHLYISASIGVSIIDNPKMTANTLIKEADIAMYEAKSKGRDGVILFNDELSIRIERKLEIERLLHFALEKGEVTLHYQPQMSLNSEIIGCEVLVRWNNEQLGNVGPDEFIPISEQTGFIVELGYYILEESFKTFSEWDKKGINLEQLSINISMRQIFHTTFIEDVSKLCAQYLNQQLSSKIVFEMTETSVAEDISKLIEIMNKIKQLGIRFSMDDFGTGYSSLSYLRQIPINELKIDKSFIIELDDIKKDTNMVKTILNIAKNLGLTVVAEGVETEMQKDFLIKENCTILQGYYFSKPLNREKFEEYVANRLKK
ncbi:MAG: diguanylate cyclase [Sulfurimonas sp. RIFCSPLOWO2_12_FULL_36_74]|uniref:putative bifunctional diguanylate cyclase/phosphodiesterase n=1 Tax=Sulfurimonas sp. RIFCSPLOWO2_12_36_12 TaxID=1802253 RepID=UPI0008D3EE2F|nr:GGDEF domain-containing phosphodiesterase [Sulfurimonas sp. RIFCSPLOWO2_12_36_12]OHE00229.1 MAG: diguanylate cyclase [Sulfurimonas sp. RIFCSPLOWO2_12_36_12]OHE07809.1 MAG: diguanylate cyclase [Sulfurimonas sp. RIFCSPLOWO2_12_FULL_36_74]